MSNGRMDQLLKFLEASPNDSFVKFALALEYINQSNDEKALEYFNEILQHDPDYTGTYYHLGKLYERLKDPPSAERVYREGLQRTQSKDVRGYRELQQALNEMLFGEE